MSSTENQHSDEILIMDAPEMGRALTRIAHEIVERNKGVKDLALVGIRTAGVPLAQRLQKIIRNIEQVDVPLGELDITLYRDDLAIRKGQPVLKKTEITFPLSDKIIVLVDDVLFTGRGDNNEYLGVNFPLTLASLLLGSRGRFFFALAGCPKKGVSLRQGYG